MRKEACRKTCGSLAFSGKSEKLEKEGGESVDGRRLDQRLTPRETWREREHTVRDEATATFFRVFSSCSQKRNLFRSGVRKKALEKEKKGDLPSPPGCDIARERERPHEKSKSKKKANRIQVPAKN